MTSLLILLVVAISCCSNCRLLVKQRRGLSNATVGIVVIVVVVAVAVAVAVVVVVAAVAVTTYRLVAKLTNSKQHR